MKRDLLIAAILILHCGCSLSLGAEINFTATVDKTYLSQSEYLNITVEVSGPIGKIPSPILPNLEKDFYILSGPSESTSYQVLNGKMSASKSIAYLLQPRHPGDIVIPPAVLTYNDKEYKTEQIKITVTPISSPSAQSAQPRQSQEPTDSGPDIFLRAEPSKNTLVQNDMVVIDYKLYFNVNIGSYEITKIPNTAGFWTEEFDLPRQPLVSTTVVDGKRYSVATIRKVALFPTKAGKSQLDPMEIQCLVREQRQSRGRRDIFDSFLDDPFFNSAFTVPKYFQSQPITLNVLPYPEKGKPADFNGAVGRYNLKVNLDRDSVQTNEPITLNVEIAGEGNVRFIPSPVITVSPDFEKYDPEVNVQTSKSGNNIRGVKTFKYLLVPRFPGVQRIEPVRFSFYDPFAKKYVSLSQGGYDIKVARGRETVMPGGGVSIAPDEIQLYGEDIHFIKTEVDLRPKGSFLYRNPGYYAAYILPFLLLMGSGIYRNIYLKRNPEIVRFRNAHQAAKISINQAKKLAAEGKSEEFYRAIGEGMKKYIADKLGKAPASVLIEEESGPVISAGVAEKSFAELGRIIEECDSGRFAPEALDVAVGRNLIERAGSLINEMEAKWKRAGK